MDQTITRALVSVADKTGVVEFCRQLSQLGVAIVSTGGTAAALAAEGIAVTDVYAYTGFPEIMDGRLKTLHPKVHGGILGRRGTDEAVMAEHGILPIDLVVVNLYPFAATVARPDCTLEQAMEQIDIGGPAMLRAAAKNHASVAAVVDPDDYGFILAELKGSGLRLSAPTRLGLAHKTFAHTARYDSQIAAHLSARAGARFPDELNLHFAHQQTLRYGENPHQQAAFYREHPPVPGTIAAATQHQGKALSYNNIADADAALALARSFYGEPACVIVKHANPCGVAQAGQLLAAYQLAYQTDPVSAFGGIIACNCGLDAATAAAIIDRQFVEVIIAPQVADEALAILAAKPNIRVLSVGLGPVPPAPALDFKRVAGGLLVQELDQHSLTAADLSIVSQRPPGDQELADLLFAWTVAKFVKSNAIVYARDRRTIAIGGGQTSRVHAAKLASTKACDHGLAVPGSVMASDAFFPFRDGIDAAAASGITAVIHPGGSLRDAEVIAAADEHGMAMVLTGVRHFRH